MTLNQLFLPRPFLPVRGGSDVQEEHHLGHRLDSSFTGKGSGAREEEKPTHIYKDLDGKVRSASQGSWPQPLSFLYILLTAFPNFPLSLNIPS